MNRSLLVIALPLCALSAGIAKAETLTTTIDGVTVTYVTTAPQRGAGLSVEEMNALIRSAAPATITVPAQPPAADQKK
jgi:hypothetical protein